MSTYLFTHDWAGEEERLGGVCTPSSIPVPSGRSSRSPSALASMVRMGEAFRSLDGTGGPATRLAAAANCRFPSRRRRRLGTGPARRPVLFRPRSGHDHRLRPPTLG